MELFTTIMIILHALFTDTTEKLENDYEIQNWAKGLVDKENLGLKVNF